MGWRTRRWLLLPAVALIVAATSPVDAAEHVPGLLVWQFARSSPFAGTRFDGETPTSGRDQRVYFLGFRKANGAVDGSVWYFARGTGRFVDTGVDMKVPVSDYAIASLQDGSFYIFGGRTTDGRVTTAVQRF